LAVPFATYRIDYLDAATIIGLAVISAVETAAIREKVFMHLEEIVIAGLATPVETMVEGAVVTKESTDPLIQMRLDEGYERLEIGLDEMIDSLTIGSIKETQT
jgi:hypothetical protein